MFYNKETYILFARFLLQIQISPIVVQLQGRLCQKSKLYANFLTFFRTPKHSLIYDFSSNMITAVCDDTQNLKETESETFFDTKFFWYRIRYFSRYQIFDTESKTIQKMEKFWNREVSKPKRHTLVDSVEEKVAFNVSPDQWW